MTKVHELQIKQSELREKINGLLNVPTGERSETHAEELREATAAAQKLEIELRAALTAELDTDREAREAAQAAGVDPETRERLELRERASMGGFLLAALQGRLPGGADAEYAAACGVTDGIPIDLFERDRPPETRQMETRADARDAESGDGHRGDAGAGAAVRVRGLHRPAARDPDAAGRLRVLQRGDDLHGADRGREGEGRGAGIDRGRPDDADRGAAADLGASVRRDGRRGAGRRRGTSRRRCGRTRGRC